MSDAKIHLCFECGQKNRVPAGAEASALCGGCGKKLYPNLAPPKKSDEKTKLEDSSNNDSNKGLLIWLIALIGAPILGIAIFFNSTRYSDADGESAYSETSTSERAAGLYDNASAYPGSPYAPPENEDLENLLDEYSDAEGILRDQIGETAQETMLIPEAFVPGLLWNKTGHARIAPFQVITEPGLKYFVKLTDRRTQEDAIGLLVEGGESIEIQVPYGTYEMKWCSGYTWFGEDIRFGPEESCSKADSILTFRLSGIYPEGYTIELREQLGGNLKTSEIDPSKF